MILYWEINPFWNTDSDFHTDTKSLLGEKWSFIGVETRIVLTVFVLSFWTFIYAKQVSWIDVDHYLKFCYGHTLKNQHLRPSKIIVG